MSLTLLSASTTPENPGMYCASMSTRDSQKPMVYMATAMLLASVNMSPMAPPNSGPRDLWEETEKLKLEIFRLEITYLDIM